MKRSVCNKREVALPESQSSVSTAKTADLSDSSTACKDYYLQGSQELAMESALTLDRLQARQKLTKNCERLVLVLVGLPARGKSFLGRKLTGFLNWHGVHCKVFNVGQYRRQVEGEGSSSADFFDANNAQAAALREQAATMALEDMLAWLDDEELHTDSFDDDDNNPHNNHRHERIAIFDATNSTHKRRQWILELCTSPERRPDQPTGCVFIESICDDSELLMENFKDKIANSPDYDNWGPEEAMADLTKRVQKYEDQYETITDDELSYIKIFNLSTKMMVNHIYGRMSKIIMPALMAWNIGTRPIFLCRPGQTLGGITTDAEDYVAKVAPSDDYYDMSRRSQQKFLKGYHLGPEGKQFSQALLEFCRKEGQQFRQRRASIMDLKFTGTSRTGLRKSDSAQEAFPLQIYTSTMPRATETVHWKVPFHLDVDEVSNLNPLDKGEFAGKELEVIAHLNPNFYQQLQRDSFHTRFPGGESYCDLIKRLDTVIVDLEQQVTPTLVVSHGSVLQMLIAYFRNSPVEECMDIDVPLHTVLQFTPARGGGWSESVHVLAPSSELSSTKLVVPPNNVETTISSPEKKKPGLWKKIFHNNPHDTAVAATPSSLASSVLDERTHRGVPVVALPSVSEPVK